MVNIIFFRRNLSKLTPSQWVRSLPMAAVLALGGCALQADYVAPELKAPAAWSRPTSAPAPSIARSEMWWRTLGDPAIDALVESALNESPTLAQAAARIDEARSTLGVNSASKLPAVAASGSLTRAQSQNTSAQIAGATVISNSASIGPSLSWEVDLFGRVRQSVTAAQVRVDARTADAAMTRLTLVSDIANGVLSLRACESSRRVWVDDIASREKTLVLTRRRLAAGFVAPVDEARAVSGIASSRTSLANQAQQCAQQVNALVALSGKDAPTVRALVSAEGATAASLQEAMPQAPASAPELPATVLAQHPNVVSADREAAAAWAEIGVARANRMPKFNLAAALTGQWLSSAGTSLDFTTWSIGPSVSATLFDGGAGAANVSAAEARYRRSIASLQGTLRSTIQEVENALSAQASAQTRSVSTRDGVTAARTTLQASEAQWKAGAISLFELEDSRRQFASAQDAEISARRDQAQAWIALVKATGGAITQTSGLINHE